MRWLLFETSTALSACVAPRRETVCSQVMKLLMRATSRPQRSDSALVVSLSFSPSLFGSDGSPNMLDENMSSKLETNVVYSHVPLQFCKFSLRLWASLRGQKIVSDVL